MQRWEYKIRHLHIERDGLVDIEKYLCQMGAEGWELIALVSNFSGDADAYFKRPLEEKG